MSENKVKGARRLTSANTATNAVSFLVDQAIKGTVNTAEVVSIDKADQTGTDGPAGYAAATPLVCQTDAFDNTLPPTSIPKMPFFRPQAGRAAIVMDPQPGDKAIAVFMKRDSSGVVTGKGDPVQPFSHRTFDQADGWLINGFLGEAPEVWLMLDPVSGKIELSTPDNNIEIYVREKGDIKFTTADGNVTVSTSAGDVEVSTKAGTFNIAGTTEDNTVDAPLVTFTGNVHIKGNLTVEGYATGVNGGPAVFNNGIINRANGITNTGGIQNTGGNTTSNSVTVETHTHTGVVPGGGNTGSPNAGT